MSAPYDLTIHFGGLTVPAVYHPLGLPPVYSLQSIKDQVPGVTMSPDDFRDLFYPHSAVRRPAGCLMEALNYIRHLVPGLSWDDQRVLHDDLEAKAWENWSYATGLSRNPA